MKKLLLFMPMIITLFNSSQAFADDDDWDDQGFYSQPQLNNYYPQQQGYSYYPQGNYYPPQPQNYGYYQRPYNNGYGRPYSNGYGNTYGYQAGNGYSRYRNYRCNRDFDDD